MILSSRPFWCTHRTQPRQGQHTRHATGTALLVIDRPIPAQGPVDCWGRELLWQLAGYCTSQSIFGSSESGSSIEPNRE